jgi:P27 family predicted phage terminase small subunit
VLRLRGTLRNGRVHNEPKVAGGVPKCPAWLSAEAKSAWKALAPDLVASGLLTRLDRNALTRYCTLWARWRDAEEFINKHGSVYTLKDAGGAARCAMQFPQVAIAHRLSLALTKLEAEFGMTPSGRSRLHIEPPPGPPSELSRFFRTPTCMDGGAA